MLTECPPNPPTLWTSPPTPRGATVGERLLDTLCVKYSGTLAGLTRAGELEPEQGVFGSLELEPEPEPLEKNQEPEPLGKKVRSRSR